MKMAPVKYPMRRLVAPGSQGKPDIGRIGGLAIPPSRPVTTRAQTFGRKPPAQPNPYPASSVCVVDLLASYDIAIVLEDAQIEAMRKGARKETLNESHKGERLGSASRGWVLMFLNLFQGDRPDT